MAFDHFGSDLLLLGSLTQGDDRHRGSDLHTQVRTGLMDLATVTGAQNLQQALLLRFLTHTGELAVLGHPDYGSRLFELIGELNNDNTRNLAKLYALEALEEEPRVKEVVSVGVTTDPSTRSRIDIAVSVIAIENDTPLNFVFPFFLNGANAA